MLETHGDAKAHLVFEEIENSTMASNLSDDEEEAPISEEEKRSHKFLHPLEVREHIKKAFSVNESLLNLVFGTVDKNGEGESSGFQIFFMNNVLVPPNRFSPATSGSMKGGDRSFLHAHSAMLT